MSKPFTSEVLKGWLDATAGQELATGVSTERAVALAGGFWDRLIDGGDTRELLEFGREAPDVLYGIAHLIDEQRDRISTAVLPLIAEIHTLVSRCVEILPDSDERNALAAHFAYRGWDRCRREGRVREMDAWAGLCAEHVCGQENVRAFLSLTSSKRSETLNARYLSDPETILVICRRLCTDGNSDPSSAAEEARIVYRWVTENPTALSSDEQAFFSGELALAAAGASVHLGRYREANRWIELAADWFHRTRLPSPWLAKVRFHNLRLMYQLYVAGVERTVGFSGG